MFLMSPAPGVSPPADALPHKTWTREELALLESTGLFDGTHFELIDGRCLIVLREPAGGEYRVRLQFSEHESVSPLSKPSDAIAVAALLR